jgi:cell division protein FtsL
MAKERVEDESNTKARPRQRSRGRGRAIVGALLLGCVFVASAVITRRSYGVRLSHELADLGRRRTQLQGQGAQLRRLISDESSRSQLSSTAQRLGMKVPSDKQVRILPR